MPVEFMLIDLAARKFGPDEDAFAVREQLSNS